MAEGNPGCDLCLSYCLDVAKWIISEPNHLFEAVDCAWREGESKPLADFGGQVGSGDCLRLNAPDVDIIENICYDFFQPARMWRSGDRTGLAAALESSRNSMQADMDDQADRVAGVPLSMELDNLRFDRVGHAPG
jgi:hypothetical protein